MPRSLSIALCLTGLGVSALADVFSWECDSFPVDGGWELLQQFCEPETWLEDGWYIQDVDRDACPDETEGASDVYRRDLTEFLGVSQYYVEWHVEGDSDRSEIDGGAPAALALGNSFGIRYTFFIARDLAKLNRDNLLPIVFVDIEPGMPHVYRLELYGADLYIWYIDGVIVDSGVPEGAFPADNARITFRGKSWHLPAVIRWDYIRYGHIPIPGSGDFDSEGDVDLRDFFYFHECASNSGPGTDAGPGCRWADMDADTDVDLIDFALFQLAFTGSD